jgi:hypothetical protein
VGEKASTAERNEFKTQPAAAGEKKKLGMAKAVRAFHDNPSLADRAVPLKSGDFEMANVRRGVK